MHQVLKAYTSYNIESKTDAILRIIAKLAKQEKPAYIHDLGALLSTNATTNEIAIYLYVAAKRNIVDYLLYNDDSLDAALIDQDKLKHNKLFVFSKNKVICKY